MAVRIRLSRVGKKSQPCYRVVVADGARKRDGRIIELVGQYEPRKNPSGIHLKKERIAYWIGKGAQPSATVAQIIKRAR